MKNDKKHSKLTCDWNTTAGHICEPVAKLLKCDHVTSCNLVASSRMGHFEVCCNFSHFWNDYNLIICWGVSTVAALWKEVPPEVQTIPILLVFLRTGLWRMVVKGEVYVGSLLSHSLTFSVLYNFLVLYFFLFLIFYQELGIEQQHHSVRILFQR